MSVATLVYTIGMGLWILGILRLHRGEDISLTLTVAILLGIVWPLAVFAVLYHIYFERNDNNA